MQIDDDGLRMGKLFELVLFGDWNQYLGLVNEFAWHRMSKVLKYEWDRMEKMRNMTVKLDIVFHALASGSCSDDSDEGLREDVEIKNHIETVYVELNIHPDPPSIRPKANFWSARNLD